jgi:hypothetical protein
MHSPRRPTPYLSLQKDRNVPASSWACLQEVIYNGRRQVVHGSPQEISAAISQLWNQEGCWLLGHVA